MTGGLVPQPCSPLVALKKAEPHCESRIAYCASVGIAMSWVGEGCVNPRTGKREEDGGW